MSTNPEQLSQAQIMDQLERMNQEMFMAGHTAGLRSVLQSIEAPINALLNVKEGLHKFLLENDEEYRKALEETPSSELDKALALQQLSEEARNATEENQGS